MYKIIAIQDKRLERKSIFQETLNGLREDYCNGISVLEYMRKDGKNRETPVIVFSVVNETEKVAEIEDLGISVYLNKLEIPPSRLIEEVEAAIKKGE